MRSYSKIKKVVNLKKFKDDLGWTALHRAAYEGDIPFVERCLDSKIDVNDNSNECSPLHRAILGMRYNDNFSTINLLLNYGARVIVEDMKMYELHEPYFVNQSGDIKELLYGSVR